MDNKKCLNNKNKTNIFKAIIILLISIIVVIALAQNNIIQLIEEIIYPIDINLLILIMLPFITFVVGIYCAGLLIEVETKTTSVYRTYLVDKLATESDKKEERNKDVIALMLKNNDEIAEYFRISKSHVKISFWISAISCIVGVFALMTGVYGILLLKDTTVSLIGLISGAVSEVISGTVFWVHNKSALQLNRYYDSLHENERFLSSITLVEKLSIEKKDDAYLEIIRKQIGIT